MEKFDTLLQHRKKAAKYEFSKGFDDVIMENHGTVVGATDMKDAYVRFETFDFSARTITNASTIGILSLL